MHQGFRALCASLVLRNLAIQQRARYSLKPVNEPGTKPPARYTYSGLYVKAANGLKLRDRKVSRLVRRVQAVVPWIEASDTPCLRAWCELEILASAVYMALRKKGVLSVEGEGSARLISDYRQLRQAQTALTRELGLSPLSRQAIRAAGGDVTDITEAARRPH